MRFYFVKGSASICSLETVSRLNCWAKILVVPAGGVSKHIYQLEKELQVLLFVQDTRMVRLTDAGTRFYREAIDLLEQMEHAAAILHQDAVPPPDKLCLVPSVWCLPIFPVRSDVFIWSSQTFRLNFTGLNSTRYCRL